MGCVPLALVNNRLERTVSVPLGIIVVYGAEPKVYRVTAWIVETAVAYKSCKETKRGEATFQGPTNELLCHGGMTMMMILILTRRTIVA